MLLYSCKKQQEDYPWIVDVNVENIVKHNPYPIQLGYFSVSDKAQVQFAQGNLQYKNGTCRFAPSQLHCCHFPRLSNDGYEDLFAYELCEYHYTIDGESWRTLTTSEWDYLLYHRTNAKLLLGQARVEGLNGLILLPDSWQGVEGVAFVSSPQDASENCYTIDEWHRMEAAGAVFLPTAGFWNGSEVSFVGLYGYYWSSLNSASNSIYYVFFAQRGISVYPIDGNYSDGPNPTYISIRLAKDIIRAELSFTKDVDQKAVLTTKEQEVR